MKRPGRPGGQVSAPATGRLAGRKEVPKREKSEDEDKPKSRFPSKRERARQATARDNRQKQIAEDMEEMEGRAVRLRISGQSLGTLREGPPDPQETGMEWVVQWDNSA
jgi:hypothetical protein